MSFTITVLIGHGRNSFLGIFVIQIMPKATAIVHKVFLAKQNGKVTSRELVHQKVFSYIRTTLVKSLADHLVVHQGCSHQSG